MSQTKSPRPQERLGGFVKSGKIAFIVPHFPAVGNAPLLLRARRCFTGADLARQRGDVVRFWQLRRRGLLYQAQWWQSTHSEQE